MHSASPSLSERMLLFLVGAAQFCLIVDMVMVMPLAPDLAIALGVDMGKAGWIGGIYTLAAALSGIIGAVFLDRFDRKHALLITLGGAAFMTLLCGFAWDFSSLMATRFLTGVFGGACTPVCYAIVADCVPPARRGQAMGKVIGAFSVASVVGIPLGLEFAHWFDWRAPFFANAAMAVPILALAFYTLPTMRGHLGGGAAVQGFNSLVHIIKNPLHIVSFLLVGIGMFSSFLLIPNLAAYVQYNLGLPRSYMGELYMAGGAVTFFSLRFVGKLLDRTQATPISFAVCLLQMAVFYASFIASPALLSAMMIYVLFMVAASSRNVCSQTVTSKIPPPHQRAGFMAVSGCISQLFAAFGAFCSSLILTEAPDKSLIGIDTITWLAIAATCIVPFLMWWVEKQARRQKAPVLPPAPPEVS